MPKRGKNAVEIDVKAGEDLPQVDIDPDKIKQVLLNIFLNALSAMPDGGRLSVELAAAKRFYGRDGFRYRVRHQRRRPAPDLRSVFYIQTGGHRFGTGGRAKNYGRAWRRRSNGEQSGIGHKSHAAIFFIGKGENGKMKNGLEILIVDDDPAHRVMLKKLLGGWGYRVTEADDGAVAIEEVRKRSFDLILMDIRMMKVSGIEALEQIKKINPTIPVIIMTAYASVETAVSALKKGAYDYLTKPLDFDELQIVIARATEHSLLKKENEYLKERLGEKFDRQNMIGQSAAMVKLLEIVEQVAPTQATILITGESGTGKEMIANAIHFNSNRKQCALC